jgi:hypothetical protein
MVKTMDEMDKTKAFIVAENHDSVTAIVHYTYVRKYVHIVKRHLTEGIDFRRGTFYRDYELVIPCEVAISRTNWGEMRELKRLKPE